tara:strand:- start:345 stop:494 length:150 start_codon:yes stop_codon:yes gene_type:complete
MESKGMNDDVRTAAEQALLDSLLEALDAAGITDPVAWMDQQLVEVQKAG